VVVIGTSTTTTVVVGPSHLPNNVRSALTKGMASAATVHVYWLPLGAGDASHCVRWNGRMFEAVAAAREHRRRQELYHSALEIRHGEDRFVIEMAPVWATVAADRGVVSEGAVGLTLLGRSRLFRYEIRRWRNGVIPDVSYAVASPHEVSTNSVRAQLLLDLVPSVPTVTWGRDDLGAGEMWNSNSLISWLLARSGHDTDTVKPPPGGRAPGWRAGLVVARRSDSIRMPSPADVGIHSHR
jgi:hypothetical protein